MLICGGFLRGLFFQIPSRRRSKVISEVRTSHPPLFLAFYFIVGSIASLRVAHPLLFFFCVWVELAIIAELTVEGMLSSSSTMKN
jgi:hypothetical protein